MPRQVLGLLVEQLVERLEEACVAIDKEGRVQFVNPAATALLGIRPQRGRGEKIWDASSRIEFTRVFVRLIQESDAAAREQIIVFPDQRAFLAQMFPVRGAGGRLSGAVAILRDMTSISKIEEDVSDVVDRLSQELKKPLTAIKGYVETLLEGAYSDPTISRRFLQVINEETNRMARLLVGLMDAAGGPQRPPSALEAVDVVSTVQEAVGRFKPLAAQKGIDLAVRACEPVPPVMADAALLSQVVTNLVDNALKFTGIQHPDGTGRIGVQVRASGGQVVIEVEDNGVGIPSEDRPRIFDRFYRGQSGPAAELGGTGLGLSIAQEIVQAAGGAIEVRSEPAQGSVFTVVLPAAR